jgi:hypothetical protein
VCSGLDWSRMGQDTLHCIRRVYGSLVGVGLEQIVVGWYA